MSGIEICVENFMNAPEKTPRFWTPLFCIVLVHFSKPRWITHLQITHVARCHLYLSNDAGKRTLFCIVYVRECSANFLEQRVIGVLSKTTNHPTKSRSIQWSSKVSFNWIIIGRDMATKRFSVTLRGNFSKTAITPHSSGRITSSSHRSFKKQWATCMQMFGLLATLFQNYACRSTMFTQDP
jgi:hypothetical protein